MASLFERLKEKQSQQLEKEQPDEPELIRRGPQPIIPLAHSRSLPSEKLLSWMINYWGINPSSPRGISASMAPTVPEIQ